MLLPQKSVSPLSTLTGVLVKSVILESVPVKDKKPPLMLQQSQLHSLQFQSPMKLNFLNAYQHVAHVTKLLMKKTSMLAEKEYSQSMEKSPLEKLLDGTS